MQINKISPDRVTLEENSIFYNSAKLGREYLSGVDADRLLAPFFEIRNLPVPGGKKRYAGWERLSANNWEKSAETFTLAGHSLGHYLSALSQWYQSGEERKKAKEIIDYITDNLFYIYNTTGSGYLGAIDEGCFRRLFDGETEGWDKDYWVPWYNLHKIYKGLLDAYTATGEQKIFTLLTAFADWAYKGLSGLDENQLKTMRKTEYGGMNEFFCNLYMLTGKQRYLEAAGFFTERELLKPLSERRDELAGLHANTQIPKVVGFAAMYCAEPEKYGKYRQAAEFFLEAVRDKHSFAIGGNSVAEHFEDEKSETLHKKNCESCNSYNMLRLCEYLFNVSQKSSIFDFYENVLINHILSSHEKNTGEKMYFTSLLKGHHKTYEKKYASWWCCTGTGMENPMKYKNNIFYGTDTALFVNLYTACTLEDERVFLEVQTDYPAGETVRIIFKRDSGLLKLKLRAPEYSKGVTALYKDKKYSACDGYIDITDSFKKDDCITLTVPMRLRAFSSRDLEHIYFKYGPVTLAAGLGDVRAEGVREYTDNELIIDERCADVPTIITNGRALEEIPEKTDAKKLLFRIPKNNLSFGEDLLLKPFFEIDHEFYSVYFKSE